MLRKAERDLVTLTSSYNSDNVFNFFVTAYHVGDYVKNTHFASQAALEAFLKDPDLVDCRDICNTAKHYVLTRHPTAVSSYDSGAVGGAAVGALAVGADGDWELSIDGRRIDVAQLAARVVAKWSDFLARHSNNLGNSA
jgi:hypothetical protein